METILYKGFEIRMHAPRPFGQFAWMCEYQIFEEGELFLGSKELVTEGKTADDAGKSTVEKAHAEIDVALKQRNADGDHSGTS